MKFTAPSVITGFSFIYSVLISIFFHLFIIYLFIYFFFKNKCMDASAINSKEVIILNT